MRKKKKELKMVARKKTIVDIAHLVGVSTATVSRAINNQCVSKKTKERILKIIEKYEYYPDSFARYLGKRNNTKFTQKNCKRLQ